MLQAERLDSMISDFKDLQAELAGENPNIEHAFRKIMRNRGNDEYIEMNVFIQDTTAAINSHLVKAIEKLEKQFADL